MLDFLYVEYKPEYIFREKKVQVCTIWCGRWDLNPHGCPLAPKTNVSAIPPRPLISGGLLACRVRVAFAALQYYTIC